MQRNSNDEKPARLRRYSVKEGVGGCRVPVAAILLLVSVAAFLPAWGDTSEPTGQSFGQHILYHQDEVTPFLKQHQEEIYREGEPQFLFILGSVLALNLVVGWIVDVISAFYFSRVFAPTFAKLTQALWFATGHLVLIMLTGIFILFLFFIVGIFLPWMLFVLLIVLLMGAVFIIQTIWVSFNYRTSSNVSGQFYLMIFAVHSLALGLCFPITKMRTASMMSALTNQVAIPQLDIYMDDRKHALTDAEKARDEVKGEIAAAQARIDQASAQQAELRKEIAEKKASEFYVFCRIVHLHAEGDLTVAHDQLNAFLVKFPNGKLIEQAKAQLTQIETELAALDAQKKQAEAAAAQAAANARADFLARAGRGEITLSEMHNALQGKTPADVKGLFGDPALVEAGQWGYNQQMVFNPLTNEKHGLTIYFVEGIVQSVDYYDGSGDSR